MTVAKVIIVTPDIVGPVKNGGIGTACYHYARTLAQAGHVTDVLFTGPCDLEAAAKWRDIYAAMGIGFWTLNDVPIRPVLTHGPRWFHDRSWAIMQFLRGRDDRYVLFQDWQANGFWPMRAKRMGLAFAHTTLGVIAHSCTEWQDEGMRSFGADPIVAADLAWTERQAIAEADVLVSPSRHMVDWLRGHDFALPTRVALCPYTFEDEASALLPPPDLSHFIFFGRLETRKGLGVLGDAVRGLLAGAGRPKRISLLGKYAQVEGVPTQTYLDDLRRDLPDIQIDVQTDLDYREAIAFIRDTNGLVIMPSLLDNLPCTVIESIAKGLNFIASDVGGIPELADPAVLFTPTADALGRKLASCQEIDFTALDHPYRLESARETWLSHVDEVCALSTPQVRRVVRQGISVCIPFYHHDRYLKRVLRSFLRMARPDVQLVFVNDGTPEKHCPIFHEMASRLEPLGHIFHTQENTGPGGARNKAASLARHGKLLFFDTDNVAFPNLVSDLEAAQAASGAAVVSAPFIAVPPMLRDPLLSDAIFGYHPSGGSLASSMVDNSLGDTCALWNRLDFEALGGFRAARFYIEDWELFIRAAGRGYLNLTFPEPLFFYTHEDHERRQTSNYVNYSVLWDQLGTLDPETLADIARTYIKHYYVSFRQDNNAE